MSMECRTAYLLVVAAFAGTLGCSTMNTKQPSATVCAATAQLMVAQTNKPDMPAAQKQELREQARETYQQALKYSPNDVGALRGLAELYELMGNRDRAVEFYQKAVAVKAQEPSQVASLNFELGMCHARAKEWPAAIGSFQEAVRLDPDNRKYGTTLGFTMARAGMYPESLACLRKAGMSDAEAHLGLARMLHHLQKDDLSRAELALAIRKDPSLPGAQRLQAELNNTAGDGAVTASYEYSDPQR